MLKKILAGIAAAFFSIAAAQATLIDASNETVVLINEDVAALLPDGFGLSPIAPGAQDGLLFAFPITASTFDVTTGTGEIDHAGGIFFAFMDATLSAENFLITVNDDLTGTITGDVSINDGEVIPGIGLFSFDVSDIANPGDTLDDILAVLTDTANPLLPLFATGALGDVLAEIFGLDLSGFDGPFAFAATQAVVSEIPVPAALYLMIAGVAGLRLAVRKRRSA
ncbi:MAG: hypothetical protein AAGD92_01425 [Pseudomonadota bacterium]